MLVRRIIPILLCVCLASGCALMGNGGNGATARRIEKTKVLRVGTSGDSPPMSARTFEGELIGFDIDLARALASILEVELELVRMPFHDLLDAVERGEVDIAISAITMTPKRNLRVAFAGPYYLSTKTMLAKPEILKGVTRLSDLKGRGLRVIAVDGGSSERMVRSVLPDSQKSFPSNQQAAMEVVLAGAADVFVADYPVAAFALLKYPTAGLIAVESAFTAEPIGIAIHGDDPLFVNLIENYLHTLEYVGLLDQFKARWFEDASWVKRVR